MVLMIFSVPVGFSQSVERLNRSVLSGDMVVPSYLDWMICKKQNKVIGKASKDEYEKASKTLQSLDFRSVSRVKASLLADSVLTNYLHLYQEEAQAFQKRLSAWRNSPSYPSKRPTTSIRIDSEPLQRAEIFLETMMGETQKKKTNSSPVLLTVSEIGALLTDQSGPRYAKRLLKSDRSKATPGENMGYEGQAFIVLGHNAILERKFKQAFRYFNEAAKSRNKLVNAYGEYMSAWSMILGTGGNNKRLTAVKSKVIGRVTRALSTAEVYKSDPSMTYLSTLIYEDLTQYLATIGDFEAGKKLLAEQPFYFKTFLERLADNFRNAKDFKNSYLSLGELVAFDKTDRRLPSFYLKGIDLLGRLKAYNEILLTLSDMNSQFVEGRSPWSLKHKSEKALIKRAQKATVIPTLSWSIRIARIGRATKNQELEARALDLLNAHLGQKQVTSISPKTFRVIVPLLRKTKEYGAAAQGFNLLADKIPKEKKSHMRLKLLSAEALERQAQKQGLRKELKIPTPTRESFADIDSKILTLNEYLIKSFPENEKMVETRQFSQAEIYSRYGMYKRSEPVFSKLASSTEDPVLRRKSLINLAKYYDYSKRWPDLYKVSNEILGLDTGAKTDDDGYALVTLEKSAMNVALDLEKANKISEALKIYQNLYTKFPKTSLGEKSLIAAFRLYEKTKQNSFVKETGLRLLSEYPESKMTEQVLMKLVAIYADMLSFENAALLASRYIKKYPNKQERPAVQLMGLKYFRAGGQLDKVGSSAMSLMEQLPRVDSKLEGDILHFLANTAIEMDDQALEFRIYESYMQRSKKKSKTATLRAKTNLRLKGADFKLEDLNTYRQMAGEFKGNFDFEEPDGRERFASFLREGIKLANESGTVVQLEQPTRSAANKALGRLNFYERVFDVVEQMKVGNEVLAGHIEMALMWKALAKTINGQIEEFGKDKAKVKSLAYTANQKSKFHQNRIEFALENNRIPADNKLETLARIQQLWPERFKGSSQETLMPMFASFRSLSD